MKSTMRTILPILVAAFVVCGVAAALLAAERTEHFDKDPGWEGRTNRSEAQKPREVRQDFGHSSTNHAGGKAGEVGGLITPAAEPAYYGKRLEPKTFADGLTASGRLMVKGPESHVLLGFFNADTVNEWRTPNTIAIRINGRGNVFYAYVEYATNRWRAGADSAGRFA